MLNINQMKNITLILLCLIVVTGCKSGRKSSSGTIDTLFADTAISDVETVDSASLFEQMESYRVQSGSEGTKPAPEPESYTENTGNRYHMIVGCFSIPQNAANYAAKMREMGYDASILEGSGGLQMVSVRSYGSYHESIAEIAGRIHHDVQVGGDSEASSVIP